LVRDFHDEPGAPCAPAFAGVICCVRHLKLAALALVLIAVATTANAQDIEPRAYSNAPIGVNFLIAGGVLTRGGLSFDPAVPVTNAQLEQSSAVLGYAHVFELWGRSGKFDIVLPYTWLSGTADRRGQPVEREVNGLGDPKLRVSYNFYGAPALRLPEFSQFEQDLIIGASLQVSVPLGQYDNERVINLGTNRWSFKPELGISKALGSLTLEVTGAATFFTNNTDFFNGKTRSQDPIYSFQGHAIYGFRSGIWGSLDATYLTGGRTEIDGELGSDLQRNWRFGSTLAIPIDPNYSVKLYASTGVSARTGNNYDLVGIALQYRWGGGL